MTEQLRRGLGMATVKVPSWHLSSRDVWVAAVREGGARGIARIAPHGTHAAESVVRNYNALVALGRVKMPFDVPRPRLLMAGRPGELTLSVEGRLEGTSLVHATIDEANRQADAIWAGCLGALPQVLHDGGMVFFDRLDALTSVLAHEGVVVPEWARERVGSPLSGGGHRVVVGLEHGDLHLGNVLSNSNGSIGLIDWDHYRAVGLPELDLIHLEVSLEQRRSNLTWHAAWLYVAANENSRRSTAHFGSREIRQAYSVLYWLNFLTRHLHLRREPWWASAVATLEHGVEAMWGRRLCS